MNSDEQRLLAVVLDLFAETFGKEAILRGGMVLRVLGSPRYTNDLDYIFVPYKSKKDIVTNILEALNTLPEIKIKHSLNSKCLRVIVSQGKTSIQVEAKVAKEMKTDAISTHLFSPQFELPKRIIHIVDHSVSMANKLAAWNERRLVRDLYDIWFFIRMHIEPDRPLLKQRLAKPDYSRLVEESERFKDKELDAFFDFFRKQVALLTNEEVESQMLDYLPPDEVVGMLSMFKAAFAKLV